MHPDRHGRLARADGAPSRRPCDGFRTVDRRRFARLTADALARLPQPFRALAADAHVEIVDVPPAANSGDSPPLCRVDTAGTDLRAIVVYRRPIELRARSRDDLVDLVAEAVTRELAGALGLEPPDWLD